MGQRPSGFCPNRITKDLGRKGKSVDIKCIKDNAIMSGANKFRPPTIKEAREYARSIGFTTFNAEKWWHFYETKNWMVGKNKMSKWKSAVWTWFIDTHEYNELCRKKAENARQRQQQREEYEDYIRTASVIKLVEMRKAPEWEFMWYLIDELRPEILKEK